MLLSMLSHEYSPKLLGAVVSEGLILDKGVEVSGSGRYPKLHSLSVIESDGKWYGWSRFQGLSDYSNFYGAEMSTSSNLGFRQDGFDTPESAAEKVCKEFGVVSADTVGNAVCRA